MKGKCKNRERTKTRQVSSLPLGAAYSTVGGSSKVMLRETRDK
ncbi:MAG: hypothetical protein ACOX1Y_10265 [Zhaonellaceae bacterium]